MKDGDSKADEAFSSLSLSLFLAVDRTIANPWLRSQVGVVVGGEQSHVLYIHHLSTNRGDRQLEKVRRGERGGGRK